MKTKQIECPNCGALIEATQLLELECPYCGSKFENPRNKDDEGENIIKQIIPFTQSEEDLREQLFDAFVTNRGIPTDIFDSLKLLSLKQYYLPMASFSGSYETSWSCTIVYRHKNKDGEEYKEYHPHSGVTYGDFDNVLAFVGEDDGLPSELTTYLYQSAPKWNGEYICSKSVPFDSSLLLDKEGNGISTVSLDLPDGDDRFIRASGYVYNCAHRHAYRQCSGGLNGSVEDFDDSTMVTHRLDGIFLVPVWYGEYSYKGEKYIYVMNDQGENFDYSSPKDYTKSIREWGMAGRLLLMLVLLLGIFIISKTDVSKSWSVWVCGIGAIILMVRFAKEPDKSTEELTGIKKVGRAKFCGEKVPNESSNYVSYKRTNQVLMWLLIFTAFLGRVGEYIVQDYKETQAQVQAQAQAKKMLDQVKGIARVLPGVFFYHSKERIGHFRQDVRGNLIKLGFVREERELGDLSSLESVEKYTIYAADVPLMSVFLNLSDTWPYSNSSDEIKFIKVSTKIDYTSDDFRNELSEAFNEELKSQLTSMGYEIKESTTTAVYNQNRPRGSYMLFGKELVKKGMYVMDEYYATYNAVEFKSIASENDVNFYAKDEFEGVRIEEPELSTTPDTTPDTASVQDLAHLLNESHKNAE